MGNVKWTNLRNFWVKKNFLKFFKEDHWGKYSIWKGVEENNFCCLKMEDEIIMEIKIVFKRQIRPKKANIKIWWGKIESFFTV